jgi:hydrogenase/urease accessory protein HupE
VTHLDRLQLALLVMALASAAAWLRLRITRGTRPNMAWALLWKVTRPLTGCLVTLAILALGILAVYALTVDRHVLSAPVVHATPTPPKRG